MNYFLLKTCKKSGLEWKQYNSLQKCPCNECKKPAKLTLKKIYKPPKKESKKRIVEKAKYSVMRIEFLNKPENQICFIDGCNKKANTIEHIAGRKGFYDDWAKENNISLYLDVRFWRPCCLDHNLELENNPELSKKYQLSKIHGSKKL